MTYPTPDDGAGRAVAPQRRAAKPTAPRPRAEARFNLVRFLNEITRNLAPAWLLHRLHGEAVTVVDQRAAPTRHHTGTLACPTTDTITIGGLPFSLHSDRPFAVADGDGQTVTFTGDEVRNIHLFPLSLPRIYLEGPEPQPEPRPAVRPVGPAVTILTGESER